MDSLPQWNEILIKLNRDKFMAVSLVASSETLSEGREAATPAKQVVYTTFNSLRSSN